MSILRYLVQGFGWEMGRQAAKETIDALDHGAEPTDEEAPPPSPRELARLDKARAKEETRRRAHLEAELQRLKAQQRRR